MSNEIQYGLMEEQLAFTELARALFSFLTPEASRIEYSTSQIRGTGLTTVALFTPNGELEQNGERYNSIRVPFDVRQLALNLREACYRVDSGTWFSARIVVTSAGEATADYNYDNEPDWDAPIDPALYANDQEKYPRAESAQPDWLKKKIAEGRAQIVAQKNRVRRR